jgi:hypothetical protein
VNHIAVELVGTQPMLHNRLWSDGSNWKPKTDREQAESRLFEDAYGSLYLPWNRPVVAIGRAAHSKGIHGCEWPMELRHAEYSRAALRCGPVAFSGEWRPQAFTRDGLPLVALPRFDRWTATFALIYDPRHYKAETLQGLLEHSGRHLGLPQFAPFAGRGPWGRFEVATWEIVEPLAGVAAAETVGA